MSILDEIAEYKRKEVKMIKPIEVSNKVAYKKRSLIATIINNRKLSIIAEIKKGSPSKGLFAPNLVIKEQTIYYSKSGASCISVLTDQKFFYGSFDFLKAVRSHTDLPVLCKDFIIDKKQIVLAKNAGADIILLIKRILKVDDFEMLLNFAHSLDLEVLVEIDSLPEFKSIEHLDFKLCGINNRDLSRFQIDFEKTLLLSPHIKSTGRFVISESGIQSKDDAQTLRNGHIDGLLVGEALIKDLSKNLLTDLQLYRNRVGVKICGVQSENHAKAIDQMNVDLIGLVLCESKRKLRLDEALKVRHAISNTKTVGVFKNQDADYIEYIAKVLHLDYVQIHGEFDYDTLSLPKIMVIPAQTYHEKTNTDFPLTVIDSEHPGSGNVFHIEDVNRTENHKYILAGGLNAENVAKRIASFPCAYVDVSSGVETMASKDLSKIKTFVSIVGGL